MSDGWVVLAGLGAMAVAAGAVAALALVAHRVAGKRPKQRGDADD